MCTFNVSLINRILMLYFYLVCFAQKHIFQKTAWFELPRKYILRNRNKILSKCYLQVLIQLTCMKMCRCENVDSHIFVHIVVVVVVAVLYCCVYTSAFELYFHLVAASWLDLFHCDGVYSICVMYTKPNANQMQKALFSTFYFFVIFSVIFHWYFILCSQFYRL